MRFALLFLLAAAPADPKTIDLTWSLTLIGNAWECRGLMNTHQDSRDVDPSLGVGRMTGRWNCVGAGNGGRRVLMGGPLSGTYNPSSGDIALTMTTGNALIRVAATMGPTSMIGTAHLPDQDAQFYAQ